MGARTRLRAALASTILIAATAVFVPGPASASAVPVAINGRIAFTSDRSGQEDIWVMDGDGANETQLTSAAGGSDEASWSPDGQRIAFISQRDGDSELYVMNGDGTAQTRLTDNTATSYRNLHSPTWSPDATQIVFQGATTLYVVNADGTNEHRLNSTYFGSMEQPSWSPDGSQIIFSGRSPSPELQLGLFLINSDGSGDVSRLTTGNDSFPRWAPDGGLISFIRPPTGTAPDIFTVHPDGTGLTNVTQTDTDESAPAWSPDGTRFVFHSDPLINNIDIYTVATDGSDKQRLTTDAAHDINPSWQPVFDTTDPQVQCGSADDAWHADNISITCTAGDSGSGLADSSQSSFQLTTSVPVGVEDSNAPTGSVQVCDGAGNCVTAGPITGNQIDRLAPDVTITSPVATTYLLHQTVNADYSCTDDGSGVTTCAGPAASGAAVDTSSVGAKSFLVTALDGVGNSATQSASYSVGYQVSTLYDLSKPTKKLVVQLRDALDANVSSPNVVLTAVSVDLNRPIGGTFGFNRRAASYDYTVQTRGLAPGVHTLQFIAGADPVVHSVSFLVR
jgi:Tol biopolymer transport system component